MTRVIGLLLAMLLIADGLVCATMIQASPIVRWIGAATNFGVASLFVFTLIAVAHGWVDDPDSSGKDS